MASATHRGYWNFTTLDSLTAVRAGTGYTGWEIFMQGITRFYQKDYGPDYAENRFKETNLYFQDDWRVRPNLTLNLGIRWEGVGAPHENKDRFSYGYGGDWNNVVPRLGFAYMPHVNSSWLRWLTGEPGKFVIRGGYGINHGRVFQSIFSQSGLNFRAQPPNGYFGDFTLNCPNEISDPSCGFAFTPGTATRTAAAEGGGVRVKGGTLAATLLLPDPQFHMPLEVSWLPAYGPEMRSGTSNCHVRLSSQAVDSPVVSRPNVLLSMNEPSLRKFLPVVEPGGWVFYDAESFPEDCRREDVQMVVRSFTKLADTLGDPRAGNMVMLGAFLGTVGALDAQAVDYALRRLVKSERWITIDRRAIEKGRDAVTN